MRTKWLDAIRKRIRIFSFRSIGCGETENSDKETATHTKMKYTHETGSTSRRVEANKEPRRASNGVRLC